MAYCVIENAGFLAYLREAVSLEGERAGGENSKKVFFRAEKWRFSSRLPEGERNKNNGRVGKEGQEVAAGREGNSSTSY